MGNYELVNDFRLQYTITCSYTATGTAGTVSSANCKITKPDTTVVTVAFGTGDTSVTSTSQFNPGTYSVDVEVEYSINSATVKWDTAAASVTIVAADVTQAFTLTNSGVR